MNTTLITRYINLAKQGGSTATTLGGTKRWFKSNPMKSRPLPFNRNGYRCITYIPFVVREDRWSQVERELRRATEDKKFRHSFLAKTRKEIRKLTAALPESSSLAEITKFYDAFSLNKERLTVLSNIFIRLTGKTSSIPIIQQDIGITIKSPPPILARKLGCEISTAGYNNQIIPCKSSSHLVSYTGNTTWRNGRPVHYTRCVRDNYIRSFAIIRDSQTVDVAFHTKEITVTLPPEYLWSKDEHGLKIVMANSRQDDFHPEMESFLCDNPSLRLIYRLNNNRDTRLRLEAVRMAELAEMDGIFVCINDSLRAGNCNSGTRSFVDRHNLNVDKHYSAKELCDIANGDWGRVRLAIKSAIIRNRREIEVGFSNLEEHRTLQLTSY